MFRITWISNLTGATGHGDAMFTESQAVELVRKNNEKYPEFIHSTEKYQQPALTLNVKGHRCSYGDLTFVGHPSPIPTPKVEGTPKPLAPLAPSASSALPRAPVCQQQSSPPPSDFSTSFF